MLRLTQADHQPFSDYIEQHPLQCFANTSASHRQSTVQESGDMILHEAELLGLNLGRFVDSTDEVSINSSSRPSCSEIFFSFHIGACSICARDGENMIGFQLKCVQ